MTVSRPLLRPLVLAAPVLLALVLAGCGGGDQQAASLVGIEQDPAPEVGDLALPDAMAGGQPSQLRAADGELLLVFFGFTHCPDLCPMTLSTVSTALVEAPELAGRTEVALVTVDPLRDTGEVLGDYVTAFVDRGRALRTDDPGALRAVADRFGASYEVTTDADGEVEVGHSAYLYAVDDTGTVVVTWPFGVTVDDLLADLPLLFDAVDDPEET